MILMVTTKRKPLLPWQGSKRKIFVCIKRNHSYIRFLPYCLELLRAIEVLKRLIGNIDEQFQYDIIVHYINLGCQSDDNSRHPKLLLTDLQHVNVILITYLPLLHITDKVKIVAVNKRTFKGMIFLVIFSVLF